MNLKDLKELIELIQGTEVAEVELQEGDLRIRVRRGEPTVLASSLPSSKIVVSSRQEAPSVMEPSAPLEDEQKYFLVRSPIVGTFYRSASPDSQPYVEVGDQVKKSQVLCIVEAMKLMNEIESEVDGRIIEISVEDASPVEYGQILFKVEPLQKTA
jgi:acetyl-CoA carboxylase biotin carboxyl carrier protein